MLPVCRLDFFILSISAGEVRNGRLAQAANGCYVPCGKSDWPNSPARRRTTGFPAKDRVVRKRTPTCCCCVGRKAVNRLQGKL
jgi:hypothetical protein